MKSITTFNILRCLCLLHLTFGKTRKHYKEKLAKLKYYNFIQKSLKPKVKDEDITVVMQGPIEEKITDTCLKTVRIYLPNAKIILSTWEGSNVDGLDYDEVIFNKDPGPSGCDNVNRQILSTKNGLKKVKTKYALKLRTNFALTGNRFLNYYGRFNKKKKNDKTNFLKEKIFVLHTFGKWFAVCDLTSFGLTEDMITYWDIPLSDESNWNYMYTVAPPREEKEFLLRGTTNRFYAEMYLFKTFVEKFLPEVKGMLKDYTDTSEELDKLKPGILLNNFIWANENIDIIPLKPHLFHTLTYATFQEFCSKYTQYFY